MRNKKKNITEDIMEDGEKEKDKHKWEQPDKRKKQTGLGSDVHDLEGG